MIKLFDISATSDCWHQTTFHKNHNHDHSEKYYFKICQDWRVPLFFHFIRVIKFINNKENMRLETSDTPRNKGSHEGDCPTG